AVFVFFFSSRRRHTRLVSDWSSTCALPISGSAATPLAALLLSLTPAAAGEYDLVQGVEMGRPSRLACSAWRASDGIRAKVGGSRSEERRVGEEGGSRWGAGQW